MAKLDYSDDMPLSSDKMADVEAALIALGYAKKEITKVLAKLDPTLDEGVLVKQALQKMIK